MTHFIRDAQASHPKRVAKAMCGIQAIEKISDSEKVHSPLPDAVSDGMCLASVLLSSYFKNQRLHITSNFPWSNINKTKHGFLRDNKTSRHHAKRP